MNEIRQAFSGILMPDEPMARHTWYRIGGPADWYCIPDTVEDLKTLVQYCSTSKTPYWVVGKGTNVLISDDGIRGAVIDLSAACQFVEFAGKSVTVGAAYQVPKLVMECEKRALGGLELFAGIPGSVGGALKMNAGCNGREIYEYVKTVNYLEPSGMRVVAKKDMAYTYRHVPLFDDPLKIIVSAELTLEPEDPAVLVERRKTSLEKRQQTQPISQPCCGSVFKNPKDNHAGRLIEQSGLKGYRVGGAAVSEKHANFIVNEGAATAADVLHIIQHIQQTVHRQYNIWLEPEVKLIGFPDPVLQRVLKYD